MKMFVMTNLIRHWNDYHPAEYEHFKDANKGKVAKAKTIQSSASSLSLNSERMKAERDGTGEKDKMVNILLSFELITILITLTHNHTAKKMQVNDAPVW